MQLCKTEAAFKASMLFGKKSLPECLCFAQSTTLLASMKSRYIGEAGHKTPTFLAHDQI